MGASAVVVVKSSKRTFTKPRLGASSSDCRPRRVSRALRSSGNSARQAASVARSSLKVRSTERDLRTRWGCTGRSSFPRARSKRRCPNTPKRSVSVGRSRARRSSQLRSPRRWSFSAVRGPTPKSFSTGRRRTKASTSSGFRTKSPSGLRQSLAIFARNLLGATPAETVSPSSSRTARRMASAMRVALPLKSTEPVTSRKASSRERGSMRSVKRRKMLCTASEASLYLSMRVRSTTSSGQRRRAWAMGMALRTPKRRAS